MAEYKPLFMYLEPASIPQIVAHIQKYLAENPIISDPEAIAEAIQQYIEDHPEIIAVSSVNGKTGNVVLTGSDININSLQSVSIETQISNLASMISSVGTNITQIESNIEGIYTRLETLETNSSSQGETISGMQTTLEGYGTRLTNVEGVASANASKNTEQDTSIAALEGNVSTLQQNMTTAQQDISNNAGAISTLQNFCNGISSFANLRIEFGEIAVQGAASGGEVAFTFKQAFTSAPFVCFGVNADAGRMIGMHTNNLTNAGGTLIIRRILDGGTTPGWAGNAVVRYMAIGT